MSTIESIIAEGEANKVELSNTKPALYSKRIQGVIAGLITVAVTFAVNQGWIPVENQQQVVDALLSLLQVLATLWSLWGILTAKTVIKGII